MIYFILFSLFVVACIRYFFRVPNQLKNVPKISFWSFLNSILTKKPVDEHFKQVVAPILRQKGYAISFGPGRWNVMVAQPEIAKQLFRNTNQFNKIIPNPHGLFGKFLGTSNILNSNGEDWKRYRRPANPIFHHSFHPNNFAECVDETLEALRERIGQNRGKPIPVNDLMEYMTLDVLGKGIFSHDFEAIKSKGSSRYHHLYKSIVNQIPNPVYFFLPFLQRYPMGKMAVAHASAVEFNQFIQSLIDQRRKDLQDQKFADSTDLLSTLLKEDPDSPYEPLTDEELINNLNVFFIAGHDTTANALSYAMYHLARNPEVQDKLRKEIFDTLEIPQSSGKMVTPTSDQLKEMNYLGLFIKEVMRLTPSVGAVNRVLQEDYIIPSDNVVIPKGTTMDLSIYGILHDPTIYPNPDKFDPERFLNGKHDTDIYMPFGGGSRMCIGINFSLMEQKVFLTMLLQQFTIDIQKNNPDYDKLRMRGLGLTRPMDLKLDIIPRF